MFPNAYAWFILASALDVMLTWVVLFAGGRELNRLADTIIGRFDLAGIVAFKFTLVLLIIAICELVARTRHQLGRSLAVCAVLVTASAPAVATLQLSKPQARARLARLREGDQAVFLEPVHNEFKSVKSGVELMTSYRPTMLNPESTNSVSPVTPLDRSLTR